MGKKKLSRFKELTTLDKVFQPSFEEVFRKDYFLKGKWCTDIFRNNNPLILELGCGKGEYTVGMARMHAQVNYMGLDIKGARIWAGARNAHDTGLQNVAFLRTRIDFIESFFAQNEVDEVWITFPDPQAKLRRRKKRLTGAVFLNRYRNLMKDGGVVHLKTDDRSLYLYSLALARYNHLMVDRMSEDLYHEDWNDETVSIQTFYEKQFLAEGSSIKYLRFRLPANQEIKELPDEVH